jgi:chromosome segregation ATPase
VQVDTIPAWLAAVGVLLVIAATLGAAVAVYKTSLLNTSLRVARETITDLRGEISDYERRETKLESDVQILKTKNVALSDRCTVLEDLLTRRKDDDEIRAEIAAVRKVVDQNVIAQLSAILQLLEGGAKP